MAAAFDVAARLAEGRPAVADFENYVWACHALGYQNPDLTMQSAQIRDVYGTEDGLDLRALEADSAALSALASLADEALRTQGASMMELSGAWEGGAAEAARDYLRRNQETAAAAAAAVRRAAGALSALREQLWRAVEGKVDAVLAIDERAGPQRAEWLAAAHVVLTGAGDRATASETVDQHLRPFVETAIGSEWTSAMRASMASVTAAYDTAIAALRPDPFATFEVPGYLGPAWVERTTPATSTSPAASVAGPSVAPTPGAATPVAADPLPAAPPAVAPSTALPAAPPMSSPMPPLGDLGGMSGLGGGMSGFGRQLADGIGDLTAATPDAQPEDLALDEPEPKTEPEEPDEPDEEEDDDKSKELDDEAEPDPTTPEPTPTPPPEPLSTDLAPRPHVVPEPPVETAALTPCEIAADEVPQVGE